MVLRRYVAIALLALVGIGMAACGGGPSSPSEEGVVLRGTFLGEGVSAASVSGRTAAAAVITVTVAESAAITTTVGADGSFTLRGLPPGSFTLVFTTGGVEVGRLAFAEVKPNQEITVTVQLTGTGIALVEQRRNGIGHGDLEIEGVVNQVLLLNDIGESRFLIAGKTVVARPGETAVREGNRGRPFSQVTVGRRVHVKGVWLAPEGATQPVLANEIKLQGGNETEPAPPTPEPRGSCAAVGAKVEVEGRITAKGGSSITVFQQGKGDFLCEATGSTIIRKGNRTYAFGELQVGWRVHVKGSAVGSAGTGTACRVQADEIKVQQD